MKRLARVWLRTVAALVGALALGLGLLSPTAVGSSRGGAHWVFVTSADGRMLARVDVDGRRVVSWVRLPPGSLRVAATIDGHRVIAVSPGSRTVTQLDGVSGRRTRVFRGFGRPVDVALSFDPFAGYVRSRFAYVTDEARGALAVLDLTRGLQIARLSVGAFPTRLVLANHELWIAHRSSRIVTIIDVSRPRHPSVVGEVDAKGQVRTLVADPGGLSLFVTYKRSSLVGKLNALRFSRRLLFRRHLPAEVAEGALDYRKRLWLTTPGERRAFVLENSTGRLVGERELPSVPSAIASVGGWMAIAGDRALILISDSGGASPTRIRIPLGRATGGLAYAVLP
jgi:hypothetical protein